MNTAVQQLGRKRPRLFPDFISPARQSRADGDLRGDHPLPLRNPMGLTPSQAREISFFKTLSHRGIELSIEGWSFWHSALVILLLAVVLSAFGIIYCRDANRQLYSELQVLTKKSDSLHVEWSRLLLEESTWATQGRIQRKAHNELHMVQPVARTLIKVSE